MIEAGSLSRVLVHPGNHGLAANIPQRLAWQSRGLQSRGYNSHNSAHEGTRLCRDMAAWQGLHACHPMRCGALAARYQQRYTLGAMVARSTLPPGKLPPAILTALLRSCRPSASSGVVIGPRYGEDAAVI